MKKNKPVINYQHTNAIPRTQLLRLFHTMLRIRKLQRKIEEEYPKDEMKTPVHLYIGQEAIAAGLCAHLKKDDYLYSNYRGHGHYLAKGGDMNALVAELYGKESGCSRGRGGSMHLIDRAAGLPGASSIVAGNVSIATGSALAFALRGEKRVAVVFFGDGAMDEGVIAESINFAVLKKLPVIYACENNFYAVCSPQRARQRLDNIYQRFSGFGIPGYRVDGNNVIDVYHTAREVIANARSGKGPSFLELRTYRWCGHSGGGSDVSLGYRTQKELDSWMRRCPVENFKNFLLGKKILTEKKLASMERSIGTEVQEAFEFAKKSRYPDPEDILKHLFKE